MFPIRENTLLLAKMYHQIAIYLDLSGEKYVTFEEHNYKREETENKSIILKSYRNGIERSKNEIKMLKLCKGCPYVISLLEDIKPNNIEMFSIFPHYISGDLKKYLDKNESLSITQIGFIASDLFSAAKYLKDHVIIHRDMKCENILIDSTGDLFQVKLIDFEWSIIYDPSNPPREKCGTVEYMAPEVFNEEQYSFGADIWSIGVVLYYIFTRAFPFGNINEYEQYMGNFRNLKYNDSHKTLIAEPNFRKLFKRIFIPEFPERWSADECLMSNWLHLSQDRMDIKYK